MLRTTDEYFYDHERAIIEDERAHEAVDPAAARRHRELADLHRARREWFEFIEKIGTRQPAGAWPIVGTDKEG